MGPGRACPAPITCTSSRTARRRARSDKGVEIHSVFESRAERGDSRVRRASRRGRRGRRRGLRADRQLLAGAAKVRADGHARRPASSRSQTVDIAAGEAVSQVVPLPAEWRSAPVARVEAPDDSLAEDNEAFAWIEGADPLEVTVVTDDAGRRGAAVPAPIRVCVRRSSRRTIVPRPRVRHRRVRSLAAGSSRRAGRRSSSRRRRPRGSASAATKSARPAGRRPECIPAVAGVDPLTVDVKKVFAFAGKDLTVVATSERGTPLVSVADARDRRLVVWSFALADTNLKNAAGFSDPAWQRDRVARASVVRRRAEAGSGAAARQAHHASSRRQASRCRSCARARSAIVRFESPGLVSGGSRRIARSRGRERRRSRSLEHRSHVAGGRRRLRVAAGGAGWPWWMWFVAIAFVLVGAEWWTWQRRVTV